MSSGQISREGSWRGFFGFTIALWFNWRLLSSIVSSMKKRLEKEAMENESWSVWRPPPHLSALICATHHQGVHSPLPPRITHSIFSHPLLFFLALILFAFSCFSPFTPFRITVLNFHLFYVTLSYLCVGRWERRDGLVRVRYSYPAIIAVLLLSACKLAEPQAQWEVRNLG